MRRLLYLLLIIVFTIGFAAGCGTNKTLKSEDTLREEVKAEMKAEQEKEEELRAQAKVEVEAEKKKKQEESKKNQQSKNPQENPEPNQNSKTDSTSTQPAVSIDPLIESNGVNYYKYRTNETVSFDIDGDGIQEKIKYTTKSDNLHYGQAILSIDGYKEMDISGASLENDYFIILEFSDKYDNQMNMIGILDYGPSFDLVTELYSIVDPTGRGEKSFVSVGSVTAEIVPPDKYNENDMDDYNYKAVILENEGIDAPVRLQVMGQTWFGRSLNVYYTTYVRLLDTTEKYDVDYRTKSDLTTAKDIKLHQFKDVNAAGFTVKAGEIVHLIATDNEEWVEIATNDGGKGWYSLKDFSSESFTGYAIFD
ncbi:SH3 domain-containing protein [Desulfosporosinus sp.]|uniref:SH3 domain-containing protein n=1 Tax=Desulfosporosinus sp. TaxID=157907 RepID=UPI0025BAB96C|nr:SH3 domain-containing protein [Desulfosporosinus sp.]MBC2727348.1 hypothetical protein [Desulfosporosinus sp.]